MVFWCTLSFCHISDKFDINVMKNLFWLRFWCGYPAIMIKGLSISTVCKGYYFMICD